MDRRGMLEQNAMMWVYLVIHADGVGTWSMDRGWIRDRWVMYGDLYMSSHREWAEVEAVRVGGGATVERLWWDLEAPPLKVSQ